MLGKFSWTSEEDSCCCGFITLSIFFSYFPFMRQPMLAEVCFQVANSHKPSKTLTLLRQQQGNNQQTLTNHLWETLSRTSPSEKTEKKPVDCQQLSSAWKLWMFLSPVNNSRNTLTVKGLQMVIGLYMCGSLSITRPSHVHKVQCVKDSNTSGHEILLTEG